MINIGDLVAILRIKDQMTPEIRKMEGALNQAGAVATRAGGFLTAGFTLPLVAAAAASIGFATEVNARMANVATLIPGNIERVRELKTEVQDLAIETGKSTSDMTGGLFQVISAFGDTADTADVLAINARAAAAGMATTTDAINLTSAVTKGYGDTSLEAVQHASDLAFVTNKLGQTTFPELAASVGRVVPLSAALSVSQEELFGVMATATGVTGNAAEVSTQLRGVMQSLLAPTADMTKLLEAAGVESGQMLIEQRGLQGVIELVTQAAEATGTPLQKFIGSIEGQTLALALSGAQSDVFTEKLAAMNDVAGATDEAFKEQSDGINAAGFAWSQLKVEMTVIAQEAGQVLVPVLSSLLSGVRDLLPFVRQAIDFFSNLPEPVQRLAVVALGLLAALGPVLIIFGQLATAVAALMPIISTIGGVLAALASGPVLLIGAAIVGLAAIWWKWGDDIKAATVSAFSTVKEWMVDKFDVVVSGVQEKLEKVRGAFTWLYDKLVWNSAVPEGNAAILSSFAGMYTEVGDKTDTFSADMLAKFTKMENELVATASRVRLSFNEALLGAGTALAVVSESSVEGMAPAMGLGDAYARIGTQLNVVTVEGIAATNGTRALFDQFERSTEGAKSFGGFLSVVKSGLNGLAGDLNNVFQRAFEGGGGVGGAVKSLATRAVAFATSFIPVVGPIISKFSGAIVAGFTKIWGGIKSLFGGPSAEEIGGRDVANAWRRNVADMMTEEQRLRANQLEGGKEWRESIIPIMDAYLGVGRTQEEALDVSNRLWLAEKEGPEAVRLVLDEINVVMAEWETKQGDVSLQVEQTAIHMAELGVATGFAAGNFTTAAEGAEALASATRRAREDTQDLVETQERLFKFQADTPRLARVELGPISGPTPPPPGFEGGTHGRYLDFGLGTDVRLHGKERVMTEGEAGGGNVTVIMNMDGAFIDGTRTADRLAGRVGDRIVRKLELERRL